MMSEHYPECRILPPINETFPQFSRPIVSLLSPLDLSLRAANVIPITPPSTPSPPRKRQRLMSDENYLWRPHVMTTSATTPTAATMPLQPTTTGEDSATTALGGGGNCFSHLTYDYRPELPPTAARYKNNLQEIIGNFGEIPQIQRSAKRPTAPQQSAIGSSTRTTTISSNSSSHSSSCEDLPTIYVDDETIVLTEDEDETLVSSHDCTDDDEALVGLAFDVDAVDVSEEDNEDEPDEEEDEEEFVDVLGNDDDDINSTLRLQTQAIEAELEESGKVLTRNKLVYDNEELHHQAIDGLAKLFECEFHSRAASLPASLVQDSDKGDCVHIGANNIITTTSDKTYIDLSSSASTSVGVVSDVASTKEPQQEGAKPAAGVADNGGSSVTRSTHHPKSHKSERKRMKLRKNARVDEETISPVSGTIIRKLRDDEELVVRKGDIDPAFNVVEVTEEAKAILASIDNKIGEYLCQLCRTLYDDAFMLAQHRCPRIMHIEYKCSECEKVFNCPANLASHRRWHKPKSEQLAGSQHKKRSNVLNAPPTINLGALQDKSQGEEGADGIFACPQCGKNFRRHAYLKKHQASHQILENLKSLDIFKNPSGVGQTPTASFSRAAAQHPSPSVFSMNISTSAAAHHHQQHHHPQHHHPHHHHHAHRPPPVHTAVGAPFQQHAAPPLKPPYPQRFATFPGLMPPFDQRRFYSLGEFYLSQHLDRSSAFQYVQANHLRNLSNVASNFMQRAPLVPTMVPSSLMTMPVK